MKPAWRIHIIIPRVDPMQMGLTELYKAIESSAPDYGQARHLLDGELSLMHPHWYKALTMLRSMGCVEWSTSHSVRDLPTRHQRKDK